MATTAKRSKSKKAKKQEYVEEPGWASAFHRPDAEEGQPLFTGEGLDRDGEPIQISVWTRRAKSGLRYLRIHIEEPYEADDDDEEEEEAEEFFGDDIPF